MPLRSRSHALSALLFSSFIVAAGCNGQHGPLLAHVSDEWTRTYTLQDDGEFQIVGSDGSIDVQGSDGSSIEVKAERIAHAASESAARGIPERIRIEEDVAPDKVVLRVEGLEGVVIGVNTEVNFHVSVPRGTKLRLHGANGDVSVSNVNGHVVASAANGGVTGKGLGGGVEMRATNGNVKVDLAGVGSDPIELRSTNGTIALALPTTADANVDATVRNGSIEVKDLPLELTGEQDKRRIRGRLNAGGAPVQLTTTNGNITITGVAPAAP
ncbi:MAG: DUF4097 family beta strand repeat-containing protein [Vicinamibacterales bacterium]